MEPKTHPEVVFFFGAGASVKAGVPDTYRLVDLFLEEIDSDENLKGPTEKIMGILRDWKRSQPGSDHRVDVELLLEVLDRLQAKDRDFLPRFFTGGRYLLGGMPLKKPIIKELRDFIKQNAVVDENKVGYMEPLLSFVQQYNPLDIFSVNYDIVVEQFCSLYKKSLVDGFHLRWTPESFKEPNDVRLFKLHGSVTWYKTDRGDYAKIPVFTREEEIKLVTGEKAKSLILYPMRKWEYDEPLLDLLTMLKNRLETAKCCIVVGYSFRDEHITRIFWDAARRSRDLNIILVSPSAQRIYEEKLRYYPFEPEKTPSSLDGRVVCLPYKFEDVLPELRHMASQLMYGLQSEIRARGEQIFGSAADWLTPIKALIEAEHVTEVNELSQEIDWDKMVATNIGDGIPMSFKMLLLSLLRQDLDSAARWGRLFLKALSIFRPENVNVDVADGRVSISFALSRTSFIPAKYAREYVLPAAAFARRRVPMLNQSVSERLKGILDALGLLESYLHPWDRDNMSLLDYRRWRAEEEATRRLAPELTQENVKIVRNIEQKLLGTILSEIESSVSRWLG